jgi:hypothetical protein
MNQSAIDWLVEQLKKQGFLYDLDIEMAKEKEKEQIKETFSDGANWELYGFQLSSEDRAELYYNEKFKNQ